MSEDDCIVVGASFAGLACATALARAGMRVRVLEKKADPGEKLHTTGILVKEAVEQTDLLRDMPERLGRRITGVRLYAPNLRHVDLSAPGYYFLTTDTPELLRWMASRVSQAGARIQYGALFREARRTSEGFDLGEHGTTRYLVGADGPGSAVARSLALGRNTEFLFGVEHEYRGVAIPEPESLHCFIDRKLAPGYIGWIAAGPSSVQVGLAQRVRGGRGPAVRAMEAFLRKISGIADFRGVEPASVRAGMIPCGGLVDPCAAERVLLTGDAAGLVSPVTAGGIHTALKHGAAAGAAIAAFLRGEREDPGRWFVAGYPRFRSKRLLRFLFDRFQSDALFNLLLRTKAMRDAASIVYFHRKGAFDR